MSDTPLTMTEAVELIRGAIPTDETPDAAPAEADPLAETEQPPEMAADANVEADAPDDGETAEVAEIEAEAAEEDSPQDFIELPEQLRQTEDGELAFRLVVDGEERLVKLDEITEMAQKNEAADKRFTEASTKAREAREHEQALSAQLTAYQENLMAFQQELEAVRAASQLTPEQERELAEEDPKALLQIKQLQQAREQKLAELANQQAQANQQRLQIEAQRALELLPSWSDPDVLKRERDGIVATATAAGFTQQEVNQIYDARYLPIFRKAWLYDQMQEGKQAVQKKRHAPKMVKKKAPVPREPAQQKRQRDAMHRLTQTGKLDDAVEALMARRGT